MRQRTKVREQCRGPHLIFSQSVVVRRLAKVIALLQASKKRHCRLCWNAGVVEFADDAVFTFPFSITRRRLLPSLLCTLPTEISTVNTYSTASRAAGMWIHV